MHLKKATTTLVESSLNRQLPKIIVQIALLILVGLIILFLIWHLIVQLADNIVKPIKNLKKIIQGLQSE